jgi:glycine dehydrogenase
MKDTTPGIFQTRHIGPDNTERDEMLRTIGVPSLDALIEQTVPADIRLARPLEMPPAETEFGYLKRLRAISA